MLTFALLNLDPAGRTGRLDSHCPAVDCHCCSAGQVCHSGQKQDAKIITNTLNSIMSFLLLLVQSTLFLSPTVKYLPLIFTSPSYKISTSIKVDYFPTSEQTPKLNTLEGHYIFVLHRGHLARF